MFFKKRILLLLNLLIFYLISAQTKSFEKIVESYSIDYEVVSKNGNRFAKVFKNDKLDGFLILSSDYGNVKGFSGETVMAIYFNKSWQIKQIEILSSEDTPSYVRKLRRKRFWEQFYGSTKLKDIESVTGATITSKAIIKTIEKIMIQIEKIK